MISAPRVPPLVGTKSELGREKEMKQGRQAVIVLYTHIRARHTSALRPCVRACMHRCGGEVG